MKRIGLIFVFFVFLAGCATPHITGRTTGGGLIGGALGAIIGGERGAYIGAALGAGLGNIIGTEEEKAGNVLVPASTVPGRGYISSGAPGYAEVDCALFSTKKEQAECERGKRAAERELQHELERRAYERGRYGY